MKTLISAHKLRKSYGRQHVLAELSFLVTEKQRIALIGRNGSGKTTLLRILAGQDEQDGGDLLKTADARLGVLDQHETLPTDITTLAYLEDRTKQPEWECLRIASRFGLGDKELSMPPGNLSGGYGIRVKIVRMLLTDPNLLILDEPVNYLDLPTLVLFEAFLRDYKGAFIITSHDREVLRNLCTTTWDVSNGNLTTFKGDIDTYFAWRDEQEDNRKKHNRKLRIEINRNQKFIDRFRFKAKQASRAQSKMKHVGKLRNQLRSSDQGIPTSAFSIECERPTMGQAVLAQDLTVGYGGTAVLSDINLDVQRGAKVAIVGENGRGKSTLLRSLAGTLPVVNGKIKWWKRADIGYYSQESAETLNPKTTVIEAISQAAPGGVSGERILGTAGAFLFHDDDLEKPCSVLSGGEQARVRLARLVLQNHNVLLLDEPTNHLDAETVEVLAKALRTYEGTVILISHARTFMSLFADDIYEVHNGALTQFVGNYEEYIAGLQRRSDEMSGFEVSTEATTTQTEKAARKAKERLRREHRKQQVKLEQKMKVFETEKSEILAWYFENPLDYAPEKHTRLQEVEGKLAALEEEWLKLEDV